MKLHFLTQWRCRSLSLVYVTYCYLSELSELQTASIGLRSSFAPHEDGLYSRTESSFPDSIATTQTHSNIS